MELGSNQSEGIGEGSGGNGARTPAGSQPRTIVRVEGFSKTYQNTPAVRDLSFSVDAGEIVGLVGPNGAGKTTTMRSIAAIIPASAGRILVDEHDVAVDPVLVKKRLAYVPDDPHLFEALTVWEHLAFTAEAYRVEKFEQQAERLLAQFELTEKRDTLTQELSRGMRQKTAICCAYLHDPVLLMLDEPMTGLDPRGIRTIKRTLQERAASGSAVIVSSHLLPLIEDMCTRLLVLHRGERIFFGSIDEARGVIGCGEGEAEATLEDVFFRITEAAGDENKQATDS